MRLLIVASLLAACSDSSVVVGDLQEITSMRAIPNRDLDVLFVIDNSPSMAEQQASLAANFTRMIDVLEQLDGGIPNLHIGVVTSDMGTSSTQAAPGPAIGVIGNGGCANTGNDGKLQHASTRLTGNYILDVALPDGTRDRNYIGPLRDVFGEIALVGAGGCGFEQHLASMRRALVNPMNAGFLRPNANLAVVIIADEDDCSALQPQLFGSDTASFGPLQSFRCTRFGLRCDPDDMTTIGPKHDCKPRVASPLVEEIKPFIDALLAAKPDPRYVMVSAIIGDPKPVSFELQNMNGESELALAPSCTFNGSMGPETAAPGVRLAAFLDAFPGRSQLTSICNADLSGALSQIGTTAKKLVGDPCLEGDLADASADPGLQPACEVLDIRDSAPTAPTLLPTCSTAGATDCYEIAADPVACPASPDNLRVRFHRTAVADDTWTHVRCQIDQ